VVAAHRHLSWPSSTGKVTPDGHYSIELPGPGEYSLLFVGDGPWVRIPIDVPAGRTRFEQDIDLPFGSLTGLVIDAETNEPVFGARVAAVAEGAAAEGPDTFQRAVWGRARTDGIGRFSLHHVPKGTYTMRASAPGFADGTSGPVAVADSERRLEPIFLERGIELTVRAVDVAGRPIPQAIGMLRDSDGRLAHLKVYERANEAGRIVFGGVRSGWYRVTVGYRQGGFADAVTTLHVDNMAEEATLVLRKGGRILASVLDADGSPVETAAIAIMDEKGVDVAATPLPLHPTSNRSGSVWLDVGVVIPGQYSAVAALDGRVSLPVEAVVRAGESAEITIHLPSG
jgi:hypothetical protein